MNIKYFQYDIPTDVLDLIRKADNIAIDTEAMGLNLQRDRLCVGQLKPSNLPYACIVHFPEGIFDKSHNLVELFSSEDNKKIFHYGRFDIAIIYKALNVLCKNVFCTRVASYVARTYSSSHSLKELCRVYLDLSLQKVQQQSYWGADCLTDSQMQYAASDVMYLEAIMTELNKVIIREGREWILEHNLSYLPYRAAMDAKGWRDMDFMGFLRADRTTSD